MILKHNNAVCAEVFSKFFVKIMFGSQTAGSNMFGAKTASNTGNMFGNQTAAPSGTTNMFGNQTSATGTPSLFGSGAPSSTTGSNMFGNAAGSTAGSTMFGSQPAAPATTLFGNTAAPATGSSMFGNANATTTAAPSITTPGVDVSRISKDTKYVDLPENAREFIDQIEYIFLYFSN